MTTDIMAEAPWPRPEPRARPVLAREARPRLRPRGWFPGGGEPGGGETKATHMEVIHMEVTK